jgi:hypothetical protein
MRLTRRVRTQPGGRDSISSIFGDEYQDQFVPTRRLFVYLRYIHITYPRGRVRQRPGGQDNIEGVSTRRHSVGLDVLTP